MSSTALAQLDNELAELRKFVALLNQEQQSLLSNDVDGLLALSESKSQAASLLTQIGTQRRSTLLNVSTPDMETWMSKHAPEKYPLWQEIRRLANEAQQLNNTNGELIQARMRSNHQALGTLFKSTQNVAGLYGPDGQTNINSAGRHLGSG